jgi:hypothetical protein
VRAEADDTPAGIVARLLPLMAVMFIAFLVIGLAMPGLPQDVLAMTNR